MQDITCPGGLAGRIRGLKVGEQKILTNRGLARKGLLQEELIKACWCETTDFGLYEPSREGLVPWVNVYQAERFFVFMHIVMATYDKIWEFQKPCQYCRARMTIPVDLTELKVKPFPESTMDKLRAHDNRFECVMPDCGKRVWFKLLTGKEERRLPKIQEDMEDQIISASLALRVLEIEGVKPKDKMDFIEDLGMNDATILRDLFEEPDGGVETTVEVACGRCKAEQDIDVPFDISFVLRNGGRGRKRRLRRKARKR